MGEIEILSITETDSGLDVTVEVFGYGAFDVVVNATWDSNKSEESTHYNRTYGAYQEFDFLLDIDSSNVSSGDELLVTAMTIEDYPAQEQRYHTVSSTLAGGSSGGGGSGGDAGIGDITLESYDITEDGTVNVDWSGSSSTNQSLTGYVYANVDGGEGYDEEFIEAVFYNSGHDNGSVTLTPSWGESGEKSVLIGARFELDGEVVKDNEQTTVQIDTGDGGDGPEPGGALEVKFINTNASNPSAGDSVEITAGYGPVRLGGLDNEWAGDLALYNGNDVIAQEPVTAIDDWKEHTFLVNLANPGEVELCAEVINQGQEL